AYRQALKVRPNFAEARKQLALALNHKAWSQVAPANATPAEAARAIELAREAAGLSPEVAAYRNTLGVPQYRARAWKQAVTALQKSVDLRKGGDGADCLFLAMTHWRLEDKQAAREWYDRAVMWMEKNSVSDELRGFRAEAAKLLGVSPEK